MKHGRTLQELAVELDRQQNAKKDYIINTQHLSMNYGPVGLELEMHDGESDWSQPFGINEIAHDQIGRHLHIPAKYYDRMREEHPELLRTNVNEWFGRTPSSRMLRVLDGTTRAFLSDKYRRLDNYEVAQTVLPIISSMPGAIVESCELTERKMYIKVVDPRIQDEVVPGDVVQAGVIISNSEVGHGSVAVHPLLFRLVCSNGMIAADGTLRKTHVGRLNEAGADYEIYRDETIEADDRAFLMKLEDTVNAAVNQVHFKKHIEKLRETLGVKIAPVEAPQIVELTAKEFNINQDEGKGILGHLIEGGDLSLYGLGNAVTRFARDAECYDRSTELERIGFNIVTMEPRVWKRINAQVAS